MVLIPPMLAQCQAVLVFSLLHIHQLPYTIQVIHYWKYDDTCHVHAKHCILSIYNNMHNNHDSCNLVLHLVRKSSSTDTDVTVS